MEERRLLGSQACVLSRDDDIARSSTASPSRGLDLVLQQRLADVSEVFLRENEPNVALDVRQQPGTQNGSILRILDSLSEVKALPFESGVVLQMALDGLANHGVLSHEHNSFLTESDPDVLHLLGPHIVGSDDEALGVFIQQLLKKSSHTQHREYYPTRT